MSIFLTDIPVIWKYDVLYSYKDEDFFYQRGLYWSEALAAKEELIAAGFAEVDIFIRFADE